MKQLDGAAIERLIAERKYDEAKTMLREFFEGELSAEEEGEVYVDAMAEYLSISNAINEAYLADMKDLQSKLSEVGDMAEEVKKDIDADKIRGDIQNL